MIQDNAAGSPHIINLSGTASGAIIALTPANLISPGRSVGTPSTGQTVTLGNDGDTALTLGSIQGDRRLRSDEQLLGDSAGWFQLCHPNQVYPDGFSNPQRFLDTQR